MPKQTDTVVIEDNQDEPLDGKVLAIKLSAMALATTAAIIGTHLVIKQIEKRED